MSNPDISSNQDHLTDLIHRLILAETDLEVAVDGQVDSVIDASDATPILLRQAQRALQASETRYRRLLTQIAALVFELTPESNILFINDTMYEVTGYSLSELEGRNWWTVLCPTIPTAEIGRLMALFQQGDVERYEITLVTKRGSPIILEMSSANRYTSNGVLTRILVLGIDVTERRRIEGELAVYRTQLEQRVAERTAELSQANAALQEEVVERERALESERLARAEAEQANLVRLKFLAMISHELRTPLTSIKGFATTLLAKDVTWNPDSQQEFIGIINSEADKLAELIDQLLDLSRLNSGKLPIHMLPTAISEILATAHAQMTTLADKHSLQIDMTPNLPFVLADARRVAQVLVNLVGNAAKYAPPFTPITISASAQAEYVQFQVRDQGPGIPVENRERVFEAFWQPEEVKSSITKGVGLGLAICRGLIEAHSGRIWIADQPLPGTTICFTLLAVQ